MNRYQIIDLLRYKLLIRHKPLTIQMPITSRCNSRCLTCNVWKESNNVDIDPNELSRVLKQDFFSEVASVGINGGEFTLVPNFIDIVQAVLTLKKVRSLYLISNGLFPKRLFEYLEQAYSICRERKVDLHICISIDGVGPVHESVRGIPNCFSRTISILDELQRNHARYCSSYSVGCTISIHNVDSIKETDLFLSKYDGLAVEYHCAIPNKRIRTFDKSDYYLLNNDQKRLLAAEFFHEKYRSEHKSLHKRYQYFSNYYFLKTKGKHRLNVCDYRNRDVTIDENLNLMLCATASDSIGNLKESPAAELLKTRRSRKVLSDVCKYCDQCGHYSYHPLNLRGRFAYINEEITTQYALQYYSISAYDNHSERFHKQCMLQLRIAKAYLRYIYRLLWRLQ